ncbi:MAG: GlsB/YeaQ/YmgE family stress response membrane protein [Candidatus Entotheonellia bacterium]
MLTLLGWIIFGLIIGALAKLVMPGRDPGGVVVTILLGIAGALTVCTMAVLLLPSGHGSGYHRTAAVVLSP